MVRTSFRVLGIVLALAMVASACGGTSSETSTAGTDSPVSQESPDQTVPGGVGESTTTVLPGSDGTTSSTAPGSDYGVDPDAPPDDPGGGVPFEAENPPTGSDTPLFDSGDIDPGLGSLVDLAIKDLANRLEVASTDIEVHSAVLVVWPDSSLGCPHPDMVYRQVPEDGSLIELSHGGKIYSYHTGGTRSTPFLCAQPLKEAPPAGDIGLSGGGENN